MPTTSAVGRTSSTTEHWRPTAHFTTTQSWLNDPNGLLYRDGTWHLFFQTNPHGASWGEIGWGHATSTDLVTWTEHPLAIPADAEEMVFSGSAVTDVNRTSGMHLGEATTLVAAYTSHYRDPSRRTGTEAQSLAFSFDEGATWQRHGANPVLDLGLADFRDPKVFRYGGQDGHWVMAVAFPHELRVGLYTSLDLMRWEPASTIDGAVSADRIWECPDLLRVPVRGGGHRWITIVSVFEGGPTGGAGVKYLVGDFDGRRFVPERAGDWQWLDHGHDYYAAATFNDAPDGRAVVIAWASSPQYAGQTPSSPWRGAMSLACDLELAPRGSEGALGLRRTPVLPAEGSGVVILDAAVTCAPGVHTVLELRPAGGQGRSRVVLALDGDSATLRIDRVACGPDALGKEFLTPAIAPMPRGTVDVRIVVDACILEVYAADGMVVLTQQVFPDAPLTELVTRTSTRSADVPDVDGGAEA